MVYGVGSLLLPKNFQIKSKIPLMNSKMIKNVVGNDIKISLSSIKNEQHKCNIDYLFSHVKKNNR